MAKKSNKASSLKKSATYLYVALPSLKKSGPLYIRKADVFTSAPPKSGIPTPKMKVGPSLGGTGSSGGMSKPALPGLKPHGQAALSAMPNKAVKAVEEEDKEDKQGDDNE